jgi:chromosome segregation ATPase
MALVLEAGATAAATAIAKLNEVGAPPAALGKQLKDLSDAVGKLNTELESANQKLAGSAGRLERVGLALERDHELFESVARSVRASTEEAALAQTAASEVLSRLSAMTRALADTVRHTGGSTHGDSRATQ